MNPHPTCSCIHRHPAYIWNPSLYKVIFCKEWKSESVQETWQRVVHWQQAWQVWLSIQFTGVRNGYGSTRWQPVETKRLVATDVHGPMHPKQMRTNLVGIAPCKRLMFCKVSASPSKTERFFRTRSATGNKVLDGNCCRNRTWQFKHRSWSCLRWQLARHTAYLNQRSLRRVTLALCVYKW